MLFDWLESSLDDSDDEGPNASWDAILQSEAEMQDPSCPQAEINIASI